MRANAYGNFLLGEHDGTVLASDTDGGDVGGGDGLESIFWRVKWVVSGG